VLLTDRIHLVASGRYGFRMSSDYDCHVYLVDGNTEVALIDTGSGLSVDLLVAAMAMSGHPVDRLRHVFLTHKHADHSGGAKRLRELADVTIHASAHTAEAIADERSFNDRLERARRTGTYPSDYHFEAARVDDVLLDGARSRVGDLTIEAVNSAGHCNGHYCYFLVHGGRRHLFTGDAVVADGLVLLQAIPDCSLAETIATVERLAALDVDVLLPGHFQLRMSNGRDDIAKCVQRIKSGLAPISAI
jgi:glyoxylase-like metal-dependent hydrolase (beta-lactamase superfamily II)